MVEFEATDRIVFEGGKLKRKQKNGLTPKQFVTAAKQECDRFLRDSFDSPPRSVAAVKIAAMKLDPRQMQLMREAIDGLLTDVFYTWLLALDGEAGLGNLQHPYVLTDEDGNLLTDCGQIEAEAYEAFHGDRQREIDAANRQELERRRKSKEPE